MIYYVDVDGTLLTLMGPNYKLIRKLNKIYDGGNHIIIFTRRPVWDRKPLIVELDEADLQYHGLIMEARVNPKNHKYEFMRDTKNNNLTFIDDDESVLDAARRCGWKAYRPEHFTGV